MWPMGLLLIFQLQISFLHTSISRTFSHTLHIRFKVFKKKNYNIHLLFMFIHVNIDLVKPNKEMHIEKGERSCSLKYVCSSCVFS